MQQISYSTCITETFTFKIQYLIHSVLLNLLLLLVLCILLRSWWQSGIKTIARPWHLKLPTSSGCLPTGHSCKRSQGLEWILLSLQGFTNPTAKSHYLTIIFLTKFFKVKIKMHGLTKMVSYFCSHHSLNPLTQLHFSLWYLQSNS